MDQRKIILTKKKMKIVVATNTGGLGDDVSPVFGRCANFTVCECEGEENRKTEVVENPAFSSAGGAGIKAAQYAVGEKAEAVIAGNFGPNAANVLKAAGVAMVLGSGKAGENVARYLRGELKPVSESTVLEHFGMQRGGPQRHGRQGRRGR